MKNKIGVNGFFRVQIVDKETGKIKGNTGWIENQITNYGLESCIVGKPINASNGSPVYVAGLILGSASTPASSAVSLSGSDTKQYSAVAMSSVVASLTARLSQSFEGSGGSSMATLGNIGVLANSTGSLIAGKGFATSEFGADQDVNATYELRYTTT